MPDALTLFLMPVGSDCLCFVLICLSGSESMGPTNLCQTHETERTHGQRQIPAAQQRRDSGQSVCPSTDEKHSHTFCQSNPFEPSEILS